MLVNYGEMWRYARTKDGKPVPKPPEPEPKSAPKPKGRPPNQKRELPAGFEVPEVPAKRSRVSQSEVQQLKQQVAQQNQVLQELISVHSSASGGSPAPSGASPSGSPSVLGDSPAPSGGSSAADQPQLSAEALENLQKLLSRPLPLSAQLSPGLVGRILGSQVSSAVQDAAGQAGKVSGQKGSQHSEEAKAGQRVAGAKFGHLGKDHGAEGGKFGGSGGRPKSFDQLQEHEKAAAIRLQHEKDTGPQPGSWLSHELAPQRSEQKAAAVRKFQLFVRKMCEHKKAQPSEVDSAFMKEFISPHFKGKRVRELMSWWKDEAKAQRVEDYELGTQGGFGKKGEHSVLRTHMGLGFREVKNANKKSALALIFERVRPIFMRWRMSGQYVDRGDLLIEFEDQAKKKLEMLDEKRKIKGLLTEKEDKLRDAIEKRLIAHQKEERCGELLNFLMQP